MDLRYLTVGSKLLEQAGTPMGDDDHVLRGSSGYSIIHNILSHGRAPAANSGQNHCFISFVHSTPVTV